MEWISVLKRVPEDRRRVLAWGMGGFCIGGCQPLRNVFLGTKKFNPATDGGKFDIERYQGPNVVTPPQAN